MVAMRAMWSQARREPSPSSGDPYVRSGRVLGRRGLNCPCVVLLLFTALAAISAAVSTPSRADPEQTERRLTSAGVDAALRRQVHTAIDRGVRYLANQQHEDGGFPGPPMGSSTGLGTTLLVALALRHAGGPETEEPLRNALCFLFEAPAIREDLTRRLQDAQAVCRCRTSPSRGSD